MPRNGSGVYSLPAGSTATTGNTAEAATHNTPLTDIVADLNAARPVVAGGTGQTSVLAAMNALGAADASIAGNWTWTGSARFNDGIKALFGTGSDAEVYHDGSNFNIDNTTGNVQIETDNFLVKSQAGEVIFSGFTNGGCILYYNNNVRVQSTNAGVDITGDLDVSTSVNAPPVWVIEDQKSSGTAGGDATSGAWRTRDMNTEARDPDGIVSISSNEFTSTKAGWVEWDAPAYLCNGHKTRLYNVTDATVVSYGSSEFAGASAAVASKSTGGGAIEASKAYRIEHRVNATQSSNGFGVQTNLGTEVYTRVKFWRT